MFGKFKEREVLFTYAVNNPDRRELAFCEPHDVAAGTAQLALNRGYLFGSRLKVSLKKFVEYVHKDQPQTCTRDTKVLRILCLFVAIYRQALIPELSCAMMKP